MKILKLIFLSTIAAIFIVFSIANREAVSISFFPLPYSADMPKFLLAMVCFSLGVVVAGIVMSLRLARSHQRYAAANKRAQALENEIKGLQAQQSLPALTNRKP